MDTPKYHQGLEKCVVKMSDEGSLRNLTMLKAVESLELIDVGSIHH